MLWWLITVTFARRHCGDRQHDKTSNGVLSYCRRVAVRRVVTMTYCRLAHNMITSQPKRQSNIACNRTRRKGANEIFVLSLATRRRVNWLKPVTKQCKIQYLKTNNQGCFLGNVYPALHYATIKTFVIKWYFFFRSTHCF